MPSIMEIMQMCRLCLVKDQVNIPIFEEQGDIRQIFLKITACLPVKVAKEDNLPKKICDGCLYKLELLYQFWNTTANAEKQLLNWLDQAGMDVNKTTTAAAMAVVSQSQEPVGDGMVKQENIDSSEVRVTNDASNDDAISDGAQSYILQQQQLPYEPFSFGAPVYDGGKQKSTTSVPSATVTREEGAEPPAKRAKRAAAMKNTVISQDTASDEEDDDLGADQEEITKMEDDSDLEGEEVEGEDSQDPEPTQFVDVPSTSTDVNQPGPSGVGKTPADTPYTDPLTSDQEILEANYECEICMNLFPTKSAFEDHHKNNGLQFSCCRCREVFENNDDLDDHYDEHKNETIVIENEMNSIGFDYSENVEAVMNIPNEAAEEDDPNNELLYILDDSQCVNEVVIEEDSSEVVEREESPTKPDSFTIVQVDHGYMIPSVFKGQLESKRRYKRKEMIVEEVLTEGEDNDPENLLIPIKVQPSTSSGGLKQVYTSPRARLQPKRRHEVPDFSAANYILLNPTEEVDIPHLKCLRCEQLFINKFVFFRHIEKGKCYVNSCDVCSATFDKNSEFYDHYLVEHTDRAICNFCFRTFMYEKNVKEHMLRHLDQFRHRCEECNKGFYTVREYRNHYKNRHMGIRHKCEICGRSFADEYYFKRHIATHAKANKITTFL